MTVRPLLESWILGRDFVLHLIGRRRGAGFLGLSLAPALLLCVLRILEPAGASPPDRAAWWDLLWIDGANLLLQGIGLWISFSLGPLVAVEDPAEGGLAYLLARPVPKWRIFLARLAACGTATALVLAAGQAAIAAAAHVGPLADLAAGGGRSRGFLFLLLAQTIAAFLYAALGALLALVTSRPLVWGIAYFFFSEAVLAGTHGVLARTTLLFHLRSLVARGFPDLHETLQREMLFPTMTLARASGLSTALGVLAGAFTLATAMGAWQFARRQWAPPARDL